MRKGKGVYCDWCGVRVRDILMLHVDLWAKISGRLPLGLMCVSCIHEKLGREPTEHDRRHPWWERDRGVVNQFNPEGAS